MPWTDGEIKKLKLLVSEKKTFKEIASDLGKTKNAIAGKCYRLGLKSLSDAMSGLNRRNHDIVLKTDKAVMAKIIKHTDQYGWSLEIDEIIEYTGFAFVVVLYAVKRLIETGYVRTCKSNVGDHVFYNDATVKQTGV